MRVLRYPSLRAPLDILFLVCCIALTADVLVPEIWGNGKTKDYPLWFWAGQQVLQKRVAGSAATADGSNGGGILGKIGGIVGTIFGTNVSRGKLSTGQIIARSVTRSVTNKVVGGVVADLGKSMGGSIGGSVGRALVRGALGGLLRR